MKTLFRIVSIHSLHIAAKASKAVLTVFLSTLFLVSHSQAVTEIITDYNGFWKSSTTINNAIKPNNAHNLLAFGYNGVRYSTGVNDGLLATRGETFIPGDFWSLPVSSITGTITSNTKIGFGAFYDGVLNGPSVPAPEWGIQKYLTDGIKGLGLGTCIANLPVGSMNFSIQNIQVTAIGDGIPDILVTQIADPTGNSYDRYELTDANGVRVGNYKDIVFTNITPVGNWTADFYEAIANPLTLTLGFTQTDRPIRLWAADFSEFGITAANLSQVKNFKINLCGNSDVAFVSYNNKSINFKLVLPVQYNFFTAAKANGSVQLAWQTVSEQAARHFEIEKSEDGSSFQTIGTVAAKNKATAANNYSYTDNSFTKAAAYYRLKQVDVNGTFTYSKVVKVQAETVKATIQLYPNPAKGSVFIEHALTTGTETLSILNLAGVAIKQVHLSGNTVKTKVDLNGLSAGNYFVSYKTADSYLTGKLTIN